MTAKKILNDAGKTEMPPKNLIINPNPIASKILASGPVKATRDVPHFLFLRLSELNGTGLAQPIITVGMPKSAGKARISGSIIEPKGSK